MPRTQRNIRGRSRRVVAARTSSSDLYRVSGSLGYSNGSSSTSGTSNGTETSLDLSDGKGRIKGLIEQSSSLIPGRLDEKDEPDVSEESSEGWSDDENEMSGDAFFVPEDTPNGESSSSESQVSSSGGSNSYSQSEGGSSMSQDAEDYRSSDEEEGEEEEEERSNNSGSSGGHFGAEQEEIDDFEHGTFEPHFGSTRDTPKDPRDAGFGSKFFAAHPKANSDEDQNYDHNVDTDGNAFESLCFDAGTGFPEEGVGDKCGFSNSSDEDGEDRDLEPTIPHVISSIPNDEDPEIQSDLFDDDFIDPARNYDARYDGALSEVVEGGSENKSGSDSDDYGYEKDNYGASNAMYGSSSGLAYGENSSRSQPDPLLKPFVGERPPTPPSPCASASEKSTRSAKSNRSAKSVRAATLAQSAEDDYDCKSFLPPPSVNLGYHDNFNAEPEHDEFSNGGYEGDRTQGSIHGDETSHYDETPGSQFDPKGNMDNEWYQEDIPHAKDGSYPPQQSRALREELPHEVDRLHGATDDEYPDTSPTETTSHKDASLDKLEKAHRRDQRVIKLLLVGMCCVLFALALALVTTVYLLRSNVTLANASSPTSGPTLFPEPFIQPAETETNPTRQPSLRATLSPSKTGTISPTRAPTPKPSLSPTQAPQSQAPTLRPIVKETGSPVTVGSGFGNTGNSFGLVVLP